MSEKVKTVNMRVWVCWTCTLELETKDLKKHGGHSIDDMGFIPTEVTV